MKLWELYAELQLNIQAFKEGVKEGIEEANRLKSSVQGVQDTAEKTGSIMDAALGHALGDFLSDLTQKAIETAFTFGENGVELASSMEETNSKIDTIFGNSAYRIHQWAKTTKDGYGIGELAAKEYAAQVAGILSTDSKNLTAEEIQHISMSLVELAGDLASFHNISFSDAWTKLLSGLRGETEAIESLGVDLRVSNLADAFGMSDKEWGALDQRTRLLNTYQYIMQETALAQGDFARTSDSYANQMRVLEENVQTLQMTFGEMLLPVMTDLVTWFNTLFGGTDNASKSVEDLKDAYVNSYASIESTTSKALSLVKALDDLSAMTDEASSTTAWKAVMDELGKTLPGISSLIDASTGSIIGGTDALKDYIEQWRTTQRELNRLEFRKEKLATYDQLEMQLIELQADQYVADVLKSGAEGSMSDLGAKLLNFMLAGMEEKGAKDSYVSFMEEYGIQGAMRLLDTMASGVGAKTAMAQNRAPIGDSFLNYFLAGGGTMELLEKMVAEYSAYEKTADQYNKDNSALIEDTKSAMTMLYTEFEVMEEYLAKADAQRKETETTPTVTPQPQPEIKPTLIIYANVDGKQVAAEVSAEVLGNIEWEIQKQTGGS